MSVLTQFKGEDMSRFESSTGWEELSVLAGQILRCNCLEQKGDEKKKVVNKGGCGYDQPDTDSDSDNDSDNEDGGCGFDPPVMVVGVKGIPRDCLLEVEVLAVPDILPKKKFISNQNKYRLSSPYNSTSPIPSNVQNSE
eukprot:CAMPEP_0119050046 /NCGR_PEP_ID=MMETSP1177-20130426/67937_1 /TAXON_ID=2985 /ORGANISM="Ochromonas sp, Strain CCMP1899" /LENGTH=138 /DNA_ID=CAMNT_0007027999 /DNA_START=117 /DNA_END=530 /DNA_ORIENTATION=+